ncbi:MAG: hypothetical protein OQK49_02970, partial [Proteobacteria bacterium]|nr:hypothetical protein [Pseudomonadota bacterium]
LAAGIRNQFSTAISSLVGANALRDDFIRHKQEFNDKARQAAAKLDMNGFVIDISQQPQRGIQLLDFLDRHNIKARNLASDKTINKHTFKKDQAVYVSLDQPQTTLIQALFATDKRFENNTFYDVSAWNLPMAWGLSWAPVSGGIDSNDQFKMPKKQNGYQKDAVAFAFNWHNVNAPAALNYLLSQQQTVFISAKPLKVDGKSMPAGSFVLPVKDQSEDDLFTMLSFVSDQLAVEWHALSTFQADSGIDVGSPQVQQVNSPNVLMVVGRGVNAYQAGSLWHLFDTQVQLPITKVRSHQLNQISLHKYTHIIVPDGRYGKTFSEQNADNLQQWIRRGGHLIGLQGGAAWADKNLSAKSDDAVDKKDNKEQDKAGDKETVTSKPYADFEADQAKRILGGAIVTAKADLSHPLAFGTFHDTQYPLMKGNVVLTEPDNPYATPMRLAKDVEAAGYVSDYWQEKLSEQPLITAERMGRGTLIQFGFNPNFRAFWYGTQRWIINAIYLADLIRSTELNK